MNHLRYVTLVALLAGSVFLPALPRVLCGAPGNLPAEANVNTEEALRAKARKLLDEVMDLLQAYQAQDAVRLAKALGAKPEAVDVINLGLLEGLGLPAPIHIAYRDAKKGADEAALDKARKAIRQWAQGYRKKTEAEWFDRNFTKSDARINLWEAWTDLIKFGSHGEPSAKEWLLLQVGFLGEFTAEVDRYTIAMTMLGLLDRDDLGEELGFKYQGHRFADPTEKVLAVLSPWILKNLPYLYFHPVERTLKLDRQARANDTPSAEYRKTHPWNANEGPNRTDPKKKPQDIQ